MSSNGFFAVDRGAFAKACDLGPDPAAAYLILAAGSGGDNRTTAWSADAIKNRLKVRWGSANAWLKRLIEADLAVKGGTRTRPRYDLPPFSDDRPSLNRFQDEAIERARRGEQPSTKRTLSAAQAAKDAGYLREKDGLWSVVEAKPNLIWLPITLVEGVVGEIPPIERLRRSRDAGTLRLLIDLYALHDLPGCCGVDTMWLWMKAAERSKIITKSGMTVWHFSKPGSQTVFIECDSPFSHHREGTGDGCAVTFFRRLQRIEEAGLIEWVLMLVEGDERRARSLFPLGILDGPSYSDTIQQDGLEWQIRQHAARAALVIRHAGEATSGTAELYEREADETLVAVERSFTEVQMIGVARLRYRPQTERTSDWMRELRETHDAQVGTYRQLIMAAAPHLLPPDPDLLGKTLR